MKRKFKVMVYNYTNINKMNNYLSPRINEHKNPLPYANGNLGDGIGQVQKCGAV
jgi:hypothetical protein